MAENGINLHDVHRLLFTHHHYDHNVDYPSFVLHGRSGRETPLNVYGPIGTEKLSSDLFVTGGFTIDLNNRLSADINRGTILSGVQDIDAGFTLEGDTWKLTAERADHFTVGGNFTLCYRIDTDDGSVVFSGDTIPCDGIRKLAEGADVLVHEVFWQPFRAWTPSPVHKRTPPRNCTLPPRGPSTRCRRRSRPSRTSGR